MRRAVTAALVLGIALVVASTPARPAAPATPGWQARDLGTLGGRWSRAVDVNDAGVVVGWSSIAPTGTPYAVQRGFVWSGGGMRELAPQRGATMWTTAIAVSRSGAVLVESMDLRQHEPLFPEILVWKGGSFTPVDQGSATGMSARGDVIGQNGFAAYEEGSAFLWKAGSSPAALREVARRSYSVPVALNERGVVVGSAYDITVSGSFNHARTRAVLWRAGTARDLGRLPGTNECEATGVNVRSWVVGTCDVGRPFTNGEMGGMPDWQKGPPTGFLWRAGRMTRLPGTPAAVADDGTVTGTTGRRAFVWRDGRTLLLPALRAGARSVPVAIDARGRILGASGGHAVIWEGSRLHDLGPGSPNAINASGWVVGARNGHATLWTPVGS